MIIFGQLSHLYSHDVFIIFLSFSLLFMTNKKEKKVVTKIIAKWLYK